MGRTMVLFFSEIMETARCDESRPPTAGRVDFAKGVAIEATVDKVFTMQNFVACSQFRACWL